jgi:hypothetical protein
MAPYREMVLCRVCETLVVVMATTRSKESLRATYRFSVGCPICESSLSMETRSDIETSTVAVIGFECKGGATKPKYRAKGAQPTA